MATLEMNEANILDAETINWRIIVYPVLLVLIVVVGAVGYYYNLQYQREQLEDKARTALIAAKTPEEMVKVADDFPGADQAALALLSAADASFGKRDYAAAISDYQRILSTSSSDPTLRSSAQIGLASALEANQKTDDAIKTYLEVAGNGAQNPYAPFAYDAVARLYEEKGDKDNERKILIAMASLDPDSPFVKQAQFKLKEMTAPPPPAPPTMPVSAAPAPVPVKAVAPEAPATVAAPAK